MFLQRVRLNLFTLYITTWYLTQAVNSCQLFVSTKKQDMNIQNIINT